MGNSGKNDSRASAYVSNYQLSSLIMIYCCSEFKDSTKQLKARVCLYISKPAIFC